MGDMADELRRQQFPSPDSDDFPDLPQQLSADEARELIFRLEDENSKLRDALEENIELIPPQHQHDYPAVNIAKQVLNEVDGDE